MALEMDKVVLKIYDDQYIGVNLAVNDKPVQEFLPFDKRLNALKKANNQLDTDVLEVSSAFKDDPFRIYACSITDDRYLSDVLLSGRKNTIIWYYYLLELIDIINKENYIDYISIESSFVSGKATQVLRTKAFCLKFHLKYIFLSYLVNFAYFLKHSKTLSFFILGFFEKKTKFVSNSKKSVLIDAPKEFNNHRYGCFLEKITDEYDPIFVDIMHGTILQNDKKNKITSVLGLVHIFSIFNEIFRFKSFIARNKSKIKNDNLLFSNIKDPNILFLFRNIILIASLRELLKKQKINFVLIQTDFNHNLKKIFTLFAKERSIPSICFFPRPLSLFRPAERIITYNNIFSRQYLLPDFYQVNDINSQYLLTSQGISYKNIILSSRKADRLPAFDKNIETPLDFVYSIILLLGGKTSVNEKLINFIIENQSKFTNVLFSIRAHPGQPLTNNQKFRLSKLLLNWFDASKKPYSHVPAKNKIVISTSSTATVEAAKSGCGVIWCPYIEEESLLMYPIMRKFGKIVRSDNELIGFLTQLFQSDQKFQDFSASCETDAKTAFEVGKSFSDGYQELKSLVDDYQTRYAEAETFTHKKT
jgi:hypothetical protein